MSILGSLILKLNLDLSVNDESIETLRMEIIKTDIIESFTESKFDVKHINTVKSITFTCFVLVITYLVGQFGINCPSAFLKILKSRG